MSQPFLATLMIPTKLKEVNKMPYWDDKSQPCLATLMIPTVGRGVNPLLHLEKVATVFSNSDDSNLLMISYIRNSKSIGSQPFLATLMIPTAAL